MATDLYVGVFNRILLKMAILRHFFNFAPLPSQILRTIAFFDFPPFSSLSNLDQ